MGEAGRLQHCKVGAEAPYLHDIAGGPLTIAPRAAARAHWLHLSDGVTLRGAHWPAPLDAPRGTVLLFTGRTEYAEKYGDIAPVLQEAGFAVVTVDWRGQGLSDRLTAHAMTGHVGRFGDYQRDVGALLTYAAALELPRPYHLLAHSMGGAIGLRALWQRLPVVSASFTAPMWGISLATGLMPAAVSLTAFSQRAGFAHLLAPTQVALSYVAVAPFEGNVLTSDRAQYARLRAQVRADARLGLGGASMGWLSEALRENRLAARAPSPDLPCLCFLGADEKIVASEAVQARMGAWPKGTLRVIPKARHEILMEKDKIRRAVLAELTDFLIATSA